MSGPHPKHFEIAGIKMIVENDRIAFAVLGLEDKWAGGRTFEPESLPIWEDMCSVSGACALDIGAYTGVYSMIARKCGASVIAFEPIKRARDRLRENAALNGFDDIEVHGEAVSDRCGETTIMTNLSARGMTTGSTIIPNGLPGKTWCKVATVSIDSLGLERLDAMKIDVERAEPLVLKGAQETLERCRPALLVEVLGDDEKAKVRAAVPGYRVKREMDNRNWLMVAR